MRKIQRKWLAGILAVLLPALSTAGLALAADVPAVVRVGVYVGNGFIALNDNDEMTGYGAFFMETLAEYANIRCEYVRLSWDECMKGLLDGRIDIVTDARKSAEREKLYDFSAQSIGQIQAAIFVKKDRENIYFNDYAAMDGLTVGFEKSAMNRTIFENYAEEHGFACKLVDYPDTAALLVALEKGEIDALGADAQLNNDALKVVSIYSTDPNYIMAAKDSEIMTRLNLAIEEMYTRNPEMIAEQYSNLANRQVYGDVLLTREEAAYLQSNPVLRVATYTNRMPSSWYDEKLGAFQGIAIDMMERLAKKTGMTFEFVPMDGSLPSEYALLRDDVELVMPCVSEKYYQGSVPISISKPLYAMSVSLAFLNRKNDNQSNEITVAIAKSNDGVMKMLASSFDNLRFKRYGTASDCLRALKSGEVDAYGNTMYELEYRLRSPMNGALHIAYSYSCPIDYCIAMRADAPEELLSILNNGIALLPQKETDRIVRNYSTFLAYEPTLAERLYENRYLVTGAGLLLAIVVLCSLWYSAVQKQAYAAIAKKSEEASRAAAEARHANAAKSDFLARMSHDMRTPMNGILGLTELSKDMEMSPAARSTMSQIANEGRFLLSLINDTLDMSKIESNKLALNLQVVRPQAVLEETLALIEAFAQERGVSCVIARQSIAQAPVRMDKLRVQQIILNILSNAVKFSHNGGVVELYADCFDQRDGVTHNKFVITDHGVGIPDDFLPKMFEPFVQAMPDDISHNGTGLGMTITKRLVDMMGGRIEVESAVGQGTSVCVYLDFPICESKEAEEYASVKARRDVLKGANVLVCDDNHMNTIVASGLLQKAGCVVDCARNGKEGMERFAASPLNGYDAILMDIRMPVLDGLQASRAIRALERADAKTVPIIALTANAFADDVEACLEAGMNAHVAKPVETARLYDALSDVIQKARLDH